VANIVVLQKIQLV